MQDRTEIHFAEDYAGARQRFLDACAQARLDVEHHVHPKRGPAGEELATDVVRLGPLRAERVLFLASGVHGPELMTGSGCQAGLVASGHLSRLPKDLGVVLIHAANPWGSAHLRRNNEDNVDICRNFLNFAVPPPHNEDYDRIKEWLPLAFSKGEAGEAARAALDRYKAEHGPIAFGRGFMAGQYHDATGVSFGGFGPVWSRRTLEEIWRKHGTTAERLAFIDYHSGLGPYAYGTTVCLQRGEALKRAQRTFGEWVLSPRAEGHQSDGKAPDVQGHTTDGQELAFPDREVTSVVLEFGVAPYEETAEVLMREHRLHHEARVDAAARAAAKRDLLQSFYPADDYWRRAVFHHSLQAVEQAAAMLTRR